jgi:uncharacterized protein involved in exopolysaccharide biosynthesis
MIHQMDSGQQAVKSEYVSFKELVSGIQSYLDEIKIHKKLLIVCLLICLFLGVYNRWTTKKIFEAEVSFMINEEQNAASGLGGTLGQFSGLLGIGADINLQKILELAKSRSIAEKVFAAKIKIDEKEDFLANHFIVELEKNHKWIKSSFFLPENPLKGFRFKEFNPEKFNVLENLALKNLHSLFLEILSTEVSEKTAIMKLRIQFTQEEVTYQLANKLYDEMSNFYIDKMIEKQRETYNDLKHKTDSLKALIESKQYKLAGIKDSYRSTWLYQEEVPKTILDQEIRMLQMVYGEALKNKEIASFSLETRTPFIQAIDLPIIPLKVMQQSWLKAVVLALFYGLILGGGFIVIRKFLREQLA